MKIEIARCRRPVRSPDKSVCRAALCSHHNFIQGAKRPGCAPSQIYKSGRCRTQDGDRRLGELRRPNRHAPADQARKSSPTAVSPYLAPIEDRVACLESGRLVAISRRLRPACRCLEVWMPRRVMQPQPAGTGHPCGTLGGAASMGIWGLEGQGCAVWGGPHDAWPRKAGN